MTDDNKRDDQKRNDDKDRKRLSDEELKDVAGGGGEDVQINILIRKKPTI